MHDIKFIRENPEAFDAGLARRGVAAQAELILELDEARRSYETMQQVAQAKRNSLSKSIGQAFAAGNKELAEQLKGEASLDKSLEESTGQLANQKATELKAELAAHPNLPDADVPDGEDEAGNAEVARWGTPRQFNVAPVEHADLGPALGLDFETGAAISGSRFTFLRGQMARLQRALGQFMLDQQTLTNGYTECAPPLLVREEALFGTGQLPKFAELICFFRIGNISANCVCAWVKPSHTICVATPTMIEMITTKKFSLKWFDQLKFLTYWNLPDKKPGRLSIRLFRTRL